MNSLVDQLSEEQARCQELLLKYEESGESGSFEVSKISSRLVLAEEAIESGDMIKIMDAYEGLKECK